MAKTTTKSTQNGSETAEAALDSGADAVKGGFEKAAKGYGQFMAFNKNTAEAVLKSANATGKGIETFNAEFFAYTRKSVESSLAATKAIMSSKTMDEAFQLQSEFGRTAFETYVDELAKFGDMALTTAKVAAEPLQERVAAFVEMVGVSRA
jgi:phasin family protein